jgi:hypothetical protein
MNPTPLPRLYAGDDRDAQCHAGLPAGGDERVRGADQRPATALRLIEKPDDKNLGE